MKRKETFTMLDETYKKILVAVDGSEASYVAFKKAVQVAKRNQAELLIGHIVDNKTVTMIDSFERFNTNDNTEFGRHLTEKYEKEALDSGLKEVSTHIDFGSPKARIPKHLAKALKADLVVCGATGLNAVEHFIIGSVSENIVRHAPCDVLVVRTGES